MGKDYFVRMAMDDGYVYEGITRRNINWIALLRLLPIIIELRDTFFFPVKNYTRICVQKPEEEYESYKRGLEEIFDGSTDRIYGYEHKPVKVVPQKIGTIIFCEEVGKLEEKLQEE